MTGYGYSLVEGYFLPPVSFTADEAFMLILGSDVMTQNFDAQYRAAAQSARSKIESVLSESRRDDVRYLQASISFYAGFSLFEANPDHLRLLRRAIIEHRRVRLHYRKRYPNPGEEADSIREVDPYGLVHLGTAWYLVAYCHRRQGIRNFRLGRIEQIELLAQIFTRPPEFLDAWSRPSESRRLRIRVLFDHAAAGWLREARSFYITHEAEHPAGLLVTLHVRQEDEVLNWLLSWGSHIRILEPDSLRQRLAEEAETMLANFRSSMMSY
jgi:predicted DNA-binding transcriptional regulator YafY